MEEDKDFQIKEPMLTQEQMKSAEETDVVGSWSRRRQVAYILTILFVIALIGAYPTYKFFNKPPTCFDAKQNQSELGVDCGGECNILCPIEVTDLAISLVSSVFVKPGNYDLVASIENPNNTAGIKEMGYTFEVYDENNALIAERSGKTGIGPREKFIIFETGVAIETKIPTKTVFKLDEPLVWQKMEKKSLSFSIKNKRLLGVNTSPRLGAVILNDSIDDLLEVYITALVFNKEGNVVAVSSTYEDIIKSNSSKEVFFTWPTPFVNKPKTGCTSPTDMILLFDRSGSMGFGGSNPTEPLTSAKEAAATFLDFVNEEDQVGLISFANTASGPPDQTLTSVFDSVKDAISSIVIFNPASEQNTNIGDGIEKAVDELTGERNNKDSKKAIVMLTDGVASRPLNPNRVSDGNYPSVYAREKAELAKDNNISIYAIGLGNSIDEKFLSIEIASSADHYYNAPTASKLKSVYSDIAKAVCEEESFVTEILVRAK